MAYSIVYSEEAKRELRRRSQRLRLELTRRVRALASDHEPPESEELHDPWEGYRRLRVLGTLRVVYRVDHRVRLIDVVKIGGRGSIYEG